MSMDVTMPADMDVAPELTLAEVERLFVEEAALLDAWNLTEWLKLLTDDVRYLVPPMLTPDANHRTAMFLIADDATTLHSRVGQLLRKAAWAENPRSRTRRLVTNFRILDSGDGTATVTANFAVWRFQFDQMDVYVGRYVYQLVHQPSGWRIRERRAIMDHEALRPHGKLSFIL